MRYLALLAALLQFAVVVAADDNVPAPTTSRSVLLIANEEMADPRFKESVVLVTRHGHSRSTIGVIVNRPFEVTLDQVFSDAAQGSALHHLHYGGPVAQGQIVFLVRGDVAPKAAITLADKLYISSDGHSLRRILQKPPPADRLRVFDGFASWAPGQLEHEVDRGDWYLLPVDVDILFDEPASHLWETLLRRATQRMVRTAPPVVYAMRGSTQH